MDTVTICANTALKTGSFPDSLKCANLRPIYKKVDPFDKNQWVYYHFYQKFMKEWYTSKPQIILNFFSIKFRLDLEKHIVRRIEVGLLVTWMDKYCIRYSARFCAGPFTFQYFYQWFVLFLSKMWILLFCWWQKPLFLLYEFR